jgi:hypothetical protein
MTRPVEVHWLYHEVGRYFPEQWERFRNGVPEAERDGDLVAAYYRLLNESTDLGVRSDQPVRATALTVGPSHPATTAIMDPRLGY